MIKCLPPAMALFANVLLTALPRQTGVAVTQARHPLRVLWLRLKPSYRYFTATPIPPHTRLVRCDNANPVLLRTTDLW